MTRRRCTERNEFLDVGNPTAAETLLGVRLTVD